MKHKRFEHALNALKEKRDFFQRKKTLADRWDDHEFSEECSEKIEDIEDAIRKLTNHSLTDRM